MQGIFFFAQSFSLLSFPKICKMRWNGNHASFGYMVAYEAVSPVFSLRFRTI